MLIYVLCDKCLLSDNPSTSLPSLPTLVNIATTSTVSSSGMTTPTLLTPIIFPGSGVKSVPAAASVDLPATIQNYASNSNIKKVASDSQSDEVQSLYDTTLQCVMLYCITSYEFTTSFSSFFSSLRKLWRAFLKCFLELAGIPDSG